MISATQEGARLDADEGQVVKDASDAIRNGSYFASLRMDGQETHPPDPSINCYE